MKKYCIFASIFGVILVIAGATMIGHYYSIGYDIDNIFSDGNSASVVDIGTVETTWTAVTEILEETPYYNESTESHSRELSSVDTASINEIEIDASAAILNFYITYSDCIRINASGNGSNLVETNVSSGKLEIDYGTSDIDFTDIKSVDLQSVVNIADSAPEIDIYIPEGFGFENISIELASGELTMSDIISNDIDIQIAAGNINLHRVNVSDSPDIELVAGEIMITSSYLNNLEIETVSGGDIYITECELLGETKIDSVTGNTDIYNNLISVDEYDFDISVLTGNVRVNGSNNIPSNSSAPHKISISKVTGDVYIEFAE